MGADKNIVNFKLLTHFVVHRIYDRPIDQTISDIWLIGDDNHKKTSRLELANRFGNSSEEA